MVVITAIPVAATCSIRLRHLPFGNISASPGCRPAWIAGTLPGMSLQNFTSARLEETPVTKLAAPDPHPQALERATPPGNHLPAVLVSLFAFASPCRRCHDCDRRLPPLHGDVDRGVRITQQPPPKLVARPHFPFLERKATGFGTPARPPASPPTLPPATDHDTCPTSDRDHTPPSIGWYESMWRAVAAALQPTPCLPRRDGNCKDRQNVRVGRGHITTHRRQLAC